jgi:Papain-like cysteine protease AvrRpt2
MSVASIIDELPIPAGKLPVKASSVDEVLLDVTVSEQIFDNWCWAAVTAGIEQAYGDPERSQCTIVSKVLGKVCCPDEKAPAACNRPLAMDEPLADGRHLRRRFDHPSHRTFEFVRSRIRGGFPIVARIDWNRGGAGHFVAITGYRREDDLTFLYISDPQNGERLKVRFEHFLSFYQQSGFWDISYETKGTRRVPRLN